MSLKENVIVLTMDGTVQRVFIPLKLGATAASSDSEIVEDKYVRRFTVHNDGAADVFVEFGNRTGTAATCAAGTANRKIPTGQNREFAPDPQLTNSGDGIPLSTVHIKGTASDIVRVTWFNRV